jgi:hypothetical protein
LVYYLSTAKDYKNICIALISNDTELFLQAKKLFEDSFNITSNSVAHININLVSAHITNNGFYLHTYPSTIYRRYTPEFFIDAIEYCSHGVDNTRIGAPIPNHLFFKKKFVQYMENKPYTSVDILTNL